MDALLKLVESIDLDVSMVLVMITINGPGDHIFNIWRGHSIEDDDITLTYWCGPGCRHGDNSELWAIIFSLELDLGNNSVINATASFCPLCPKAFVIKGASELFMVDEELNSPRVEALCG